LCGIAGIVNIEGHPVDPGLLFRMTKVLSHRGPDDRGHVLINSSIEKDRGLSYLEFDDPEEILLDYNTFSVGLGHRRLSIIDLSKSARQPLSNEDRTIWIIFNGEIYNFLDLRKELISKGHHFNSRSDTEVVLHLYEEMGPGCVGRLRGMFAFGIWDQKMKRLFLARDRVGKKPLVYTISKRGILFASEMKAILQDPYIKRELDLEALDLYFTYGYVPSPKTIFKGIFKLPPASILIFQKNKIEINRYWKLYYSPKFNDLSIEDLKVLFFEKIKDAVRLRMISDVPLGAFLSGGIDSSTVVAIMSQISSVPVKTFTIGFEDEDYNEILYARKVAKIFNTDHHEEIIKPDAMEIIPTLFWHYDEPYADSSCIPTYYVSKITRQHVKVALNGDGGDESFGGYLRYIGMNIQGYLDLFPRFTLSLLNLILHGVQKALGLGAWTNISYTHKFLETLLRYPDPLERYIRWISYFMEDEKEFFYSEDFKKEKNERTTYEYLIGLMRDCNVEGPVDSSMNLDILSYLPEDLLVKVDIASMANSLEARSPFLDHEIMEFAAKIPVKLKVKGLTTKYFLRKALQGILPEEILKRRKMGFRIPIGPWFRGELKEIVSDVILGQKLIKRGYFKENALRQLVEDHISGKKDNQWKLWALFAFELWCREFLDKSPFRD
jgi:asparagine synthase (glutamine-hydrolysing)